MLQDDPHLEVTPLSPTTIMPIRNEQDMLAQYANYEVPGVVLPQLDQDLDPEGDRTRFTKQLMDLFIQLPYENQTVFFDSKEEYLAFYRWELESTVQDDWYFPRWLLKTEKKADVVELMSMKEMDSSNHLVLENTTSDSTMSDRAFYGTGQMFLTPLKLDGIHEDHDFQFPLKAKSFHSKEQQDAFRYTNKPLEKELMKMARAFYTDRKFNEGTMMRDLKDDILQIDFSILAALEGRPEFHPAGSILYLDVASRQPMGIWMSSTSKLVLPSQGNEWEHAKFSHRVGERAVLTAHHVQESHFAWSHSIANAALQTLAPEHALRVLVKPFTLNAHSVNSAAYHMLVRDHSVLTHGSGLTSDGVTAAFHTVYTGMNYSQTVPDMLDSHDLDRLMDTSELPLFDQGKRLYEVHRKYVEDYIFLLYPTDESLIEDPSVTRFWNHVNTQGRHTDPCVCGMSSDVFFEDDYTWPTFENDHTCAQLLDSANFLPDKNIVTRRQRWCRGKDVSNEERLGFLYNLLEKECSNKKDCRMMYGRHTLRSDMGLAPLQSRKQLVEFLATAMWHITAGHEFTADNISYFADPTYAGVRLRAEDQNGDAPLQVDVGTYVWGTSIASLTTVRGPPLLANWSPLCSFYASSRHDLPVEDRRELLSSLTKIHQDYKFNLLDLSTAFLRESTARPLNQRSNVFVPAVQTSSVSV